MIQSVTNFYRNLKLLEVEFPNKELIYIEDAVQFIRKIVKTDVKQTYIYEYLKQKGYKRIETKPSTNKTKVTFVEDEEFDLDDFLDSNQLPSTIDGYSERNSHSFTTNNRLIQEYNKSSNQEVYSKIIVNNLRLVQKEAKKLENWMKHKLSYNDLVQEGIFGLMEAVKRFDPSLGNQFSTYAVWWIRQAIFRAICNTGTTVRIPVHMIELINKLRKAEKQSIINENKINKKLVCEILDITPERYEQLKIIENNFFQMTSLNVIVSEEDGDTELIEFISSDSFQVLGIDNSEFTNPVFIAEKKEVSNIIHTYLGELKEKERDIIMYHYGLMDGQERTLEEIGKIYGVTRERIRQIEKRGMERLRNKIKKTDWAI